MLDLIMKSYFDLFVSVGVGCSVAFIIGLYLIVLSSRSTKEHEDTKISKQIITKDVPQIAGDDVIATQLDLARAFIETNQVQSAKQILQYVLKNGTNEQRHEATELLGMM